MSKRESTRQAAALADPPQLLREAEVRRLLAVSRVTLWTWRRRGVLPPDAVVHVGGILRYRADVLARWVADSGRPAAA